jgi:CP12 domain
MISEYLRKSKLKVSERKFFLVIEMTETTSMNNIQTKIDEELANARAVCDIKGGASGECAAAWDAVEELQAEAAHQKQTKPKNSFEKYCDDNPDAAECRLYED